MYTAWRRQTQATLPLLMIGYKPSMDIIAHIETCRHKQDIHFLVGAPDELLLNAYQGASVFVFPSLEEGFGFPIAEAMAAGCPVITTDEAPMNEVGGAAAAYIKRCPSYKDISKWANESAKVLETTLQLSTAERTAMIRSGLNNVNKFYGGKILDSLEQIYEEILADDSN